MMTINKSSMDPITVQMRLIEDLGERRLALYRVDDTILMMKGVRRR